MYACRQHVLCLVLVAFIILTLTPIASYAPTSDRGGVNVGGKTESSPLKHQDGIPKPTETEKEMSLLDLIRKGGVVGYVIILLSIISLGLIIDYSFTTRRSRIMPPEDIAMLQHLIESGNLEELPEVDERRASFLTKVTMSGLRESTRDYQSINKAMEDSADLLTTRIARKTEHLNVIGSISPMMGLLGTVIGMLRCFNEIANTPGAIEPRQLAGGIFEALITTCMGLIVAIPSLYCYALFRNRVDEYTGEAWLKAESLLSSFKAQPKGK